MNTSPDYTPLECLLLFQSLVAYGTNEDAFNSISDTLISNALIQEDENYNAARLKPEALRELYLQLLAEELTAEVEGHENGGEVGSRKRKLPTPTLPSLKDAENHSEKLPLLVERLYARYRERMVRAIRDDEEQFAKIQREIAEIERGEWDDGTRNDDDLVSARKDAHRPIDNFRPKSNGTSSVLAPPRAPEIPASTPTSTIAAPGPPSIHNESRTEGLGTNIVPNLAPGGAVSPPKVVQKPSNASAPKAASQHIPTLNGQRGPSPLQPPIQPVIQSPGGPFKWEPPYQGAPQHSPAPYPPSGYPYNHQYPPQTPFQPPLYSPHARPQPQFPVPSSPHTGPQQPQTNFHPPPATSQRSSSQPSLPLDALADAAGQQYRAPSGSPLQPHAPQNGQYPQPVPSTPTNYSSQGSPPPGGYPHTYPSQFQRPPSGPSNGSQPQWTPQHMQPPYQSSPQGQPQHFNTPGNQRPPYPARPELLLAENRQYNSPYNGGQAPRQPLPGNFGHRQSLPSTPVAQFGRNSLNGYEWRTKWTPEIFGSATPRPVNGVPQELPPPEFEQISPILRPAKLPVSKKQSPPGRAATQPKPKEPKPKETKQKGAAQSKAPKKTAKDTSVASPVLASNMDESHVKDEAATPRLPDEETGDTTADDLPAPRSKKFARASTTLKRKRDDVPDSPMRTYREPPTQVAWTRNFPKISTSALERVNGNKNAVMFAAPIKERDAPGYSKIILRPQDLKTIKSAITNGNKAAILAEAALKDEDKPSGKEGAIMLPISEDLIPPKGIINYSQLEKELMRMFANAIMFNPDPHRGFGSRLQGEKSNSAGDGYQFDEDGVVNSTIEMFSEVEEIIGGLRTAERNGSTNSAISGIPSGVKSTSVRGSSIARGSVRGSSVVPTETEEDDGEDTEIGSTAGGSVAKRRRKA
ncbi:hypothetical protein B0O99DRAFT_607520 [Bisporella sp. PMI_857]|nr:hypothetical protein B0O99DRAFT_607520 [Bisporella sp. PMI_857]